MKKTNKKPSDFAFFCRQVHDLSATELGFDDWYGLYHEMLKMIWWNPDVDLPEAIKNAGSY